MGDKSPKSKDKAKKQDTANKASAKEAATKKQTPVAPPPGKGKK